MCSVHEKLKKQKNTHKKADKWVLSTVAVAVVVMAMLLLLMVVVVSECVGCVKRMSHAQSFQAAAMLLLACTWVKPG